MSYEREPHLKVVLRLALQVAVRCVPRPRERLIVAGHRYQRCNAGVGTAVRVFELDHQEGGPLVAELLFTGLQGS